MFFLSISYRTGALLQFTERLGELCRTHPNAATLPSARGRIPAQQFHQVATYKDQVHGAAGKNPGMVDKRDKFVINQYLHRFRLNHWFRIFWLIYPRCLMYITLTNAIPISNLIKHCIIAQQWLIILTSYKRQLSM